jgi:predicted heme/steroid binding protein/uncharacterized membrane protein
LNKIISEEELRANDGQEGRPAYVVYQGQVYDVSESRMWRQGTHVRRHQAGNDLTDELAAAPHDTSVFERVPLVGQLEKAVEAPEEAPPSEEGTLTALLDFYFEQHPHPVAVHFPVALSVVVALFVALYLITGSRVLETTAYYVLWVAVLMGPASIATGAFSWWFNYGHKFTANFRDKMAFSTIYVVLGTIALALRTFNHDVLVERESLGWVYVMLVMAQIVVVSILGRVGTHILFPPKK